ncbi:MAG TPA: alkaline phosphatase family protein, partial [Acidimicrobiales bacterium]|nr:alkaline phosphatase family protein [Acidimicrobiales bacterium]
VFIVVLENESYASTFGKGSPATYLNSLVPKGAFADRYYATSHVSADNYIAMTSGQTPLPQFNGDCANYASCYEAENATPGGGKSVTDQLTAAHLTWGAYMESMASPCLHPALTDAADPYQKGYATRHDPFVYYPPVAGNQAYCDAHVRNYDDLVPLLRSHKAAAVPNYVFITPDTCDDGHDAPCADGRPGGLAQADKWLRANVPLITGSAAYRDRGALFITFDEADPTDTTGCCASGVPPDGINGGGLVGLVMLSPLAAAGHATDVLYDHDSLLRTVEDGFGLAHLNNAGATQEHPMADLFRGKS